MYLISLFIFTYFTIIVNGNKLKYYSNFKFEKLVFGQEDLVVDYLTLAEDPKGNLPESYTTCSSVFVEFVTTTIAIIQMLKQDGTPWYSLAIYDSREYDTMSETLQLWYENPTTGEVQVEFLSGSHIPIVPHSWYHICMGLDTVSGLLRIVVNGVVMVNEEKDYFRNTVQWKPKSLERRLLLLRNYISGYWYRHSSVTSNLNIFSSMMSVEDMVSRTTRGDECDSPGDYIRQEMILIFIFKMNFDCFIDLSWEEAQWNVTGNVKSGSVDVDHELCAR